MSLIRINMRPSRDSLRTFGFLCALFLAALGAAAMRRGDPWVAIAAWLAGAAAAVLAVFAPKLLRWVHVAASCADLLLCFLLDLRADLLTHLFGFSRGLLFGPLGLGLLRVTLAAIELRPKRITLGLDRQ